ncbi:hypothetical protein [Microbacterium rhizophilus]|uniref:hypothetical protein n=1 Tax=Microbacterium rhizophilus TaxID=3138934 RepID=UPI0031EF4346
MVRVLFREGAAAEVAADLISFDAGEAVFWRGEAEIARHALDRMGGVRLAAHRPDPADVMAGIRRHHPRAYERWDDAEDERLLQLDDEGRTAYEIAGVLGRQESAIRSRLLTLTAES